MSRKMSVTFLGTSSGGGPVVNRNCSSLALDIAGSGSLWLVDCAEGTLRQFLLQPGPSPLRVNRVDKIFITHMHFDHCMGLITLLANLLRGSAGTPTVPLSKPPIMNLYGPAGLRRFVRSVLAMTSTTLTERYAVHELLVPSDERTCCDVEALHMGESPGKDILCDKETGRWEGFLCEAGLTVDAASISHRIPCLGYVFSERPSPPLNPSLFRKLVILGDTSDPSEILPLAHDADLLVHEATDAYIPVEIDRSLGSGRKTIESVKEKTIMKGHSTPGMAGSVARRIGARALAMNHFSAKFPAPAFARDRRHSVMAEIERQASEAWGMGQAIAAYDFLRIDIPVRQSLVDDAEAEQAEGMDYGPGDIDTVIAGPSNLANGSVPYSPNVNNVNGIVNGYSRSSRSRGSRGSSGRCSPSPYVRSPRTATFNGNGRGSYSGRSPGALPHSAGFTGSFSRGGGASPYPHRGQGRGRGHGWQGRE